MGRNAAPVKLLCMIARFFSSVKGNTREMQDCPGSLHPGVKARRITSSLATERQAVNRQPWRQLPALVDWRESSLVQQALQTDLQRLNAGNRATRPTATQSIESGTRPRAAMAGDPASRSIDRRKSIAPMACKREAGGAKSKQRSRGNPLTGSARTRKPKCTCFFAQKQGISIRPANAMIICRASGAREEYSNEIRTGH